MLMSDVVYQSSRLTIGPTAKACKNTIGPVRISLTGQYNLFRKFSEWWFGPESKKKLYREDWYTCTHMFIHLIVVINFGWCFQNCRSSYVHTKQENIFLSSRHRCDFWRKTIEGFFFTCLFNLNLGCSFFVSNNFLKWLTFTPREIYTFLEKKYIFLQFRSDFIISTEIKYLRVFCLKFKFVTSSKFSDSTTYIFFFFFKRLFCENKYQSNSIFL